MVGDPEQTKDRESRALELKVITLSKELSNRIPGHPFDFQDTEECHREHFTVASELL